MTAPATPPAAPPTLVLTDEHRRRIVAILSTVTRKGAAS